MGGGGPGGTFGKIKIRDSIFVYNITVNTADNRSCLMVDRHPRVKSTLIDLDMILQTQIEVFIGLGPGAMLESERRPTSQKGSTKTGVISLWG